MQRMLVLGVVLCATNSMLALGQTAQPAPFGSEQAPAPLPSAQQPTAGAIAAPTSPDPEMATIAPSAKAFLDAFNQHDAKAIAALWTDDGEYIDESGKRFVGRQQIERQYAQFFTANPGAQISFVVDRVRQPAAATLIEEGRAIVKVGDESTTSRYVVVHKQVEGKWRMAVVRDSSFESSPEVVLKDLAWLVGSWSAEENDNRVESICRWLSGKKFLERKYSLTRGGKVVASGVQVIGWNPQSQRVQSWIFTSDGGHSVGIWTPSEKGWSIETHGMLADGTPTEAVNLFSRIDDRSFTWRSIERSAGGTSLPDTDEVLLQRVESEPTPTETK